ncbi:MAG: hypothetical protein ACI392_03875 [Paludibacteraceae bacterium]
MEEKGNKIIGKIECYIKQNGTPPDSLLEVGINDCDDFYPFYYEKRMLQFYLSICHNNRGIKNILFR